jgi:LPXTG-motif cell wall-anchored protein
MNTATTNSRSGRNAALVFSAIFIILSIWQMAIGNLDLSAEGLGILTAAGVTLSLYSFLYDDNPLFKTAEHLFVGVSLGYTTGIIWYSYLLPDLITPLVLQGNRSLDTWLLLIPLSMGIMMILQVVSSISWISRIPFSYVVGYGSGISITANISAQLLEQIYPTISPSTGWSTGDIWLLAIFAILVAAGFYFFRGQNTAEAGIMRSWIGPVVLTAVFALCFFTQTGSAALILIGVVSVLVYFFFSVEHIGSIGAMSRVGIWFLMVSFGASFGFTIMARISLLIGRMQFLLGDWLNLIGGGAV